MMILQNSPINSRIPKFYELTIKERQDLLRKLSNLNEEDIKILNNFGNLSMELGDQLSENVIGAYTLPFSIATNFRVNSKDYLIPMVTEESSVVAAASYGAKLARKHGGFTCELVQNLICGQIQILPAKKEDLVKKILTHKNSLLDKLNSSHPTLVSLGGGAKDLTLRKIATSRGYMYILELEVDVMDAMGANIVNTMVENLGEQLQSMIQSRVLAKIVSNLTTHRLSQCRAIFDKEELGGKEIVDNILDISAFGEVDPFRAATHNKGIMNGITALALATGNDTRAIEAAAHAYASMEGKYKPLSKYYEDNQGNLVGKISIPLAMGIVGGSTSIHPLSKIAIKILGITSASELIQIAGAVGLGQNLAALRALANEGIQQAHMQLHRRKFST